MSNPVIGMFFFVDPTVTKEVYMDIMQIFVILSFAPEHLNIVGQQNGALQLWGKIVRNYLNEELPVRWIRRDGPMLWPHFTPNIIENYFFLWCYVKEKVYASTVTDIEVLKARITRPSKPVYSAITASKHVE